MRMLKFINPVCRIAYYLQHFADWGAGPGGTKNHPKKCNTLRNLDFRVCESVELSTFYYKKIHTACILEKRKAYRSTPGAPDARSKHYLLHLKFSGVRKCRTVSILRKKNPYGLHSGEARSVSLDSWSSRLPICILFTAFLRVRGLPPQILAEVILSIWRSPPDAADPADPADPPDPPDPATRPAARSQGTVRMLFGLRPYKLLPQTSIEYFGVLLN